MTLPKENPTNSSAPEAKETSELDNLLSLMAQLNLVKSESKTGEKSEESTNNSDNVVAEKLDASEKSSSGREELKEVSLFDSSLEKKKVKNQPSYQEETEKTAAKKDVVAAKNKAKRDSRKTQKDESKKSDRSSNSSEVKASQKQEKTGGKTFGLPDPKDAVVDITIGGETRVRHSTYKEKLQQQRIAEETAKKSAAKVNDLRKSEAQAKTNGHNSAIQDKEPNSKDVSATEKSKIAKKKSEKPEQEAVGKNAPLEKEKEKEKEYAKVGKNREVKRESPAPVKDEKAEEAAISGLFNLLFSEAASGTNSAKTTQDKAQKIEDLPAEKAVELPKTDEIVPGKKESQKTANSRQKEETQEIKVEPDLKASENTDREIERELSSLMYLGNSPKITAETPGENAVNKTQEDDSFMSLQNILFGPEIDKFKELNTELETKLTILQRTISDPQELTNLMLPLISDLLILKIAEAKQEVAWAIAPIIDEAIERKTLEDPEGIVRAMAPLMAPAITAQIKQSPKEFAKAIGPEIAAAVEEQIRLGRDTMVDALAPIIDRMIQKKTQDDKGSIIDAIAPLLPAAISEQIRTSPKEVARAIGPEIGQAIREQIKIDRDEIAEAIAPEMGRAIKEQITLERDSMVDALYPVIGSTISRYMAEAIQEINDKLARAVSMDGFTRKIRAKIQGVSEAELIFSEVMHFTVQAVFLIHKGSGLIITEAQHPGRERLESEMVAGMLTAIRSFVNDCIAQSGEVSELSEIEYGDSKIMIEVAGYFYLAVVIKGEPDKKFVKKMRDTVSTIILQYGRPIEEFEGDPDSVPEQVIELVNGLIEVVENKKKAAKFPVALIFLLLLIVGGIFVPWGYYRYRWQQERQLAAEMAAAKAKIEQQVAGAWASSPSLALYNLKVEVEEGAIALSGRLPNERLRNKAEEIAKKAAPNLELDNKIVAVEVPPEPEQVTTAVERVTGALNKIKGVSVVTEYAEEKVTVQGTVMDMAQSQIIVQELEQIPGVKSVVSTIKLSPLTLRSRIYFNANSAKLNPAYQETIVQIKEFLSQYPEKHLKIEGYSDRVGSPKKNEQLATQRAEAVRDALVDEGVDPRRLEISGSSTPPPDVESNQPLLLSRCVLFEPFEPGAK